MKTTMAALPALWLAGWANAHEGHGIAGAGHWHASDAWGFVALGVAALAAFWFFGKK